MTIKVRCPNGHLLQVKEKHAEKTVACPRCSAPVKVSHPRQDDPPKRQAEKVAQPETGHSFMPLFHYRHLKVRKEEDLILVQFIKSSIIDERTIQETAEELLSLARQGKYNMVVSFSGMTIVLSSLLSRLVTLQKQLEPEGRQLRLSNVSKQLREVLAAAKLDQVLHIEKG